jgi:hypothetical protein
MFLKIRVSYTGPYYASLEINKVIEVKKRQQNEVIN